MQTLKIGQRIQFNRAGGSFLFGKNSRNIICLSPFFTYSLEVKFPFCPFLVSLDDFSVASPEPTLFLHLTHISFIRYYNLNKII